MAGSSSAARCRDRAIIWRQSDPVGRVGLGQRRPRPARGRARREASVLADDLRPAPDAAVDGDENLVGLLAERVAGDQSLGRATRAFDVAAVESLLGDVGQRVLEVIGESLAFGREAVVPEAFGEVAAEEPDGGLCVTAAVVEARLERRRHRGR